VIRALLRAAGRRAVPVRHVSAPDTLYVGSLNPEDFCVVVLEHEPRVLCQLLGCPDFLGGPIAVGDLVLVRPHDRHLPARAPVPLYRQFRTGVQILASCSITQRLRACEPASVDCASTCHQLRGQATECGVGCASLSHARRCRRPVRWVHLAVMWICLAGMAVIWHSVSSGPGTVARGTGLGGNRWRLSTSN
jgi:hypothetical protein